MAVDPVEASRHYEMLGDVADELDEGRTSLSFHEWIELQASLQRAIGVGDPKDLGPTPARMYFVLWNMWALADELHEAMDEMPWKPWATSTRFDRKAVIREIVDAMHFLANILRVVDCTGAELTTEYLRKNLVNLQRQTKGYDGKTGKCGACGRELSDLDEASRKDRVSHTYHHLGPEPVVVEFCNRSHLDHYERTIA